MSSPHDVAVTSQDEAERRQAAVTNPRDDRWARRTRLDVGLRQSSYTSPLPSPDDLDRYAAHLPDAAERLLSAGEREQAHRHQIENRLAALDEQALRRFYTGQRVALAISLTVGLVYLGGMVLAILHGYPLVGVGGAAFGIAAVISAVRRDPSAGREGAGESPVPWSDPALRASHTTATEGLSGDDDDSLR
jgi:uncharacterized membrane protein